MGVVIRILNSLKRFQSWEYLYVSGGVLAIVLLKLEVPTFQKGLTGSLFIALVACTAILGDLGACVVVTVLSVLAQNFLRPGHGFDLSWMALFESLELAVASVIICWLARRERKLRGDNTLLVDNAQKLKKDISKLRRAMKGKSKEATTLRELNSKLDTLVNQFINDQASYDARWINKQPPKRS